MRRCSKKYLIMHWPIWLKNGNHENMWKTVLFALHFSFTLYNILQMNPSACTISVVCFHEKTRNVRHVVKVVRKAESARVEHFSTVHQHLKALSFSDKSCA